MNKNETLFQDAINGLLAGDFSRLAPLFDCDTQEGRHHCKIIEWFEQGLFVNEPKALAEALTCACFLGRKDVVNYLLNQSIDATLGVGTGLNAFHWAANRGQLDVVKLLIQRNTPLEIRSMYEGTVLGTAVWAAINEPKAKHLDIIEELINAGAQLDEAGYPTGDKQVDDLLLRHGVVS